jgi:hypothetical protein
MKRLIKNILNKEERKFPYVELFSSVLFKQLADGMSGCSGLQAQFPSASCFKSFEHDLSLVCNGNFFLLENY